MRTRLLLYVAIACIAASGPGLCLPLNGYNEVYNGDFELGNLSGWQAGADILAAQDGPGHGWAATCKSSGVDVWLRQIVDDSLSPDWDWDYDAKILDLMADITWSGLSPNSLSGIWFRLDWWDERWNSLNDPTQLPYYPGPPPNGSDPAAGYVVSDWVQYSFAGIPQGQWITVNPFNQILLPLQPRWVSVEVMFIQAPGEAVWVDNFWLTGKCVPEPSGILLLATGMAPILWSWRRLKK